MPPLSSEAPHIRYRGTLAPAFFALVAGAVAMGVSPVFVRLADVGPYASAFWRVALSLPFLWLWLHVAERFADKTERQAPSSSPTFPNPKTFSLPPAWRYAALAGVFFAGDLFFWHLAILNTTVANATLLATMTPIVVVLGGWLLWRRRIGPRILVGVAMGVVGAILLVGASARLQADNVTGDIFGLVTALFFGSYFLAVAAARRHLPAARIMWLSTLVTTAILWLVALLLEPRLLPVSLWGWGVLAALALISQVGGQGLMAYALGHLPPVFSSLVLYLEAVTAAIFGWLLFAEPLTAWQALGGGLIFGGIYLARPQGGNHGRT